MLPPLLRYMPACHSPLLLLEKEGKDTPSAICLPAWVEAGWDWKEPTSFYARQCRLLPYATMPSLPLPTFS